MEEVKKMTLEEIINAKKSERLQGEVKARGLEGAGIPIAEQITSVEEVKKEIPSINDVEDLTGDIDSFMTDKGFTGENLNKIIDKHKDIIGEGTVIPDKQNKLLELAIATDDKLIENAKISAEADRLIKSENGNDMVSVDALLGRDIDANLKNGNGVVPPPADEFDHMLDELTNVTQGSEQEIDESGLDVLVDNETVEDFKNTFKNFAAEYAMAMHDMESKGAIVDDGFIPKPKEEPRAPETGTVIAESKTNIIKTDRKLKGSIDSRTLSKLDKVKKLKRRGNYKNGYLPNSNMFIRAYSMDTALKKTDLQQCFIYRQATTFTTMKLAKMLYDNSLILCSDGHAIPYETFLDIVHLDDLDAFLYLHFLAANPSGKLKDWNVKCVKGQIETEKGLVDDPSDEACGVTEDIIELDVAKMYEESCYNEEFLGRMKRYDRTKSFKELSKENPASITYTYTIDIGEYGIAKVKCGSPSLKKYFTMAEKIKEFTIEYMLTNYESIRLAIKAHVPDFKNKAIDEKLSVLSTNFREEFINTAILLQVLIFVDSITLYPREYFSDPDADIVDITTNKTKYEDYIIDINVVEDEINVIMQFLYEIPNIFMEELGAKVQEDNKSIRQKYTYRHTCKDCGVEKEHDDFIITDVFSQWTEGGITSV